MKRWDVEDHGGAATIEAEDGDWVRFNDVAPLIEMPTGGDDLGLLAGVRTLLDAVRAQLNRVEDQLKAEKRARDDAERTPTERLLHAVEVEKYTAWYFGGDADASRFAKFRVGIDAIISERDEARATARVLAHAYEHDSRPPDAVVKRALGYPVVPGAPEASPVARVDSTVAWEKLLAAAASYRDQESGGPDPSTAPSDNLLAQNALEQLAHMRDTDQLRGDEVETLGEVLYRWLEGKVRP